jgi:hypothetical protein
MPFAEFGLRLAHPEPQVSQKGRLATPLATPLRRLKAVASEANRVYHPLVFLVDEPIDGFIAKRIFLANPRTAAHCFSGACATERALPSHIGFSAGHEEAPCYLV